MQPLSHEVQYQTYKNLMCLARYVIGMLICRSFSDVAGNGELLIVDADMISHQTRATPTTPPPRY